jgi:pimeloyl-ACP methyl ester carboxylesterase
MLLQQSQLARSAEFMWRTLPRVKCAMVYVRGLDSDLVPLDLSERIVAVPPHGRLANIPDAGHFRWFGNPKAIIEVLREFLVQR